MMFGSVPYQHLMNNYAAFILPSVSTSNNNETNDSVPILPTTDTTTMIVSQSQTTLKPSLTVVCTSSSSNTSNNDRSIMSPSLLTKHPSSNIIPSLIILHHKANKHYVLQSYCCPINTSNSNSVSTPQHVCNFKRDCVISRTKVYASGQNMCNLSPTVYKTTNTKSKKLIMGR